MQHFVRKINAHYRTQNPYITFMKRRSFLYSASLGTLGFSYFSGLPNWVTQQKTLASIDGLFQALGAQAQNWLATEPALDQACAEALTSWKQVGYEPLHKRYFMCKKEQTAIYTLCLRHEELGLLDVSALVFQKEVFRSSWNLCAELTGFQLEALAKAAASLSETATAARLADLLLPTEETIRQNPHRFATTLGEVSVSARLELNKAATITAAVYENSQALWTSEYRSEYLQPI